MSHLPSAAPPVTPDSEDFWAATAQGRLLLRQCRNCRTVIWPPRGLCPECRADDVEWVEASGSGIVYSFTVSRRGEGAYREVAPYVLAYVELPEGPRVLTNLVDVDPDQVRVGMAVTAVFDDTGEGSALVRFRPAGQEGEGR